MAKKRRHHKHKVSSPKRRKKRRMNGPLYSASAVGRHRKQKRRHMHGPSGGASLGTSLKNYTLMLLGGGVAKIGSDMVTTTLRPMVNNDIVLAIGKGIIGSLTFHIGGGSQRTSGPMGALLTGAGIGIGVSAAEDAARAARIIAGPADKDLYVVLDDGGFKEPISVMNAEKSVIGAEKSVIGAGNLYPGGMRGPSYAFDM